MSNSNIRIIVENNIPYVKGLLDPYATVRYLEPEEITPKAVRDTDGLVVRTRTRCDASLLDKSDVKIIATATIGTDHIDKDYCDSHSIVTVNAPGCNAPAVAQYVFASLMQVINRPIASYTIGIVGVGHVGSIVARWAQGLGMRVLLCDPPRQRAEGGDCWTDLATIAREADIITFHTPLTREGADATFHLAGRDFFRSLRRAPIIINSARGGITDTLSLVEAKKNGYTGPLIIDCWEGEPAIDSELLCLATIATPHIAGYSQDGKVRASQIVMDAMTTFFMLPRVTVDMPMPMRQANRVAVRDIVSSYDPRVDTAALKENPGSFEALRNHYKLRREVPEAWINPVGD